MKLVAVAALFALAPILSADVLPGRTSTARRTPPAQVERLLSGRGLSGTESAAQVRAMSARDLEYFSGDARRVQLASGIPIEDILTGVGVLVVAGALAGVAAYQANR